MKSKTVITNAKVLKNFTPHIIRVIEPTGKVTELPSVGIARVATGELFIGTEPVLGLPVTERQIGGIAGLPEPEPGVLYVVSSMVLSVVREDRHDCIAPDTGRSAARDERGQITAVTGWVR